MNRTLPRRKRAFKLTPWVDLQEKERVEAAAASAGMSTHEWCRRAFAYAVAHMPTQQKAT